MIRAVGRLVVAATLAAGSAGPLVQVTLFRFADPRITEASGIAAGLRSPDVFYVQNDSGDTNRFFAVNGQTGRTAATVTVTGAQNVDWEDIAVAPDRAGTPSVWLADIGDNDAVRRSVQVYRVAEPRVDASSRNRVLRVPVAEVWRVRYLGGPTNAEGLAVAPDGTAYIVTKSIGASTVYRLPAAPNGGRVQALHRVGRIKIHSTGTDNPFGIIGEATATGAAISADGALFVVRTYADAWIWPLGTAGLGAALDEAPVVVPLRYEMQGEGIAVVGDRLVTDSEGAHTVVSVVPLPKRVTSTANPTQVPSAGPTAGGGAGESSDSGGHGTIRLFVLVALLVAGLGAVGSAVRTRRPR